MLHRLPVTGVKRRDVARGLAEIEIAHSAAVANRARSALSGLFSWCIREGYEIVANPVTGTNRPTTPSRERVLSEAELRAVWRALNGSDFGRILKLLILTACRRDEIGKLRWSEIDLDARLITLPPSRTKNKRQHVIPLSSLAVSLLPERVSGRDYVFGLGNGFSGYARAKELLDQRSGVKGFRTHDLRRI
jgi:integrase